MSQDPEINQTSQKIRQSPQSPKATGMQSENLLFCNLCKPQLRIYKLKQINLSKKQNAEPAPRAEFLFFKHLKIYVIVLYF